MPSEETFDGQLVEAFPDVDLPAQPIDMRMTPDGTKWWIVGMEGEIIEVRRNQKSRCHSFHATTKTSG